MNYKEELDSIVCQSNSDYIIINYTISYIEKLEKENKKLRRQNKQLKQQNKFLMKQDNILQTLMQWLYKQIEELENIPKDEEMSIEAYGRLNAYRITLIKIKDLKEDICN